MIGHVRLKDPAVADAEIAVNGGMELT